MEAPLSMAAKLGLPPGFRFVPTDEEVVEHYLVGSIRRQPLPPGDVIVDDPLSAAPWVLLERHGRKGEAFFFAVGQTMNAKGGRKKRTCVGVGTWEGQGKRKRPAGQDQEEDEGKKLRISGIDEEIEWEKYALNFHEAGVKGSTGWVMHEYSITAPPELAQSPLRVYRIRLSGHGKNAKKRSRDAQHWSSDWGSDDEDEEEVDDAAHASICCAVEENPALYYPSAPQAEYVASFPVAAVDVVNGSNPDDGAADAVAGNDQDLPVLVDDDSLDFMNSLPDLVTGYDFSR